MAPGASNQNVTVQSWWTSQRPLGFPRCFLGSLNMILLQDEKVLYNNQFYKSKVHLGAVHAKQHRYWILHWYCTSISWGEIRISPSLLKWFVWYSQLAVTSSFQPGNCTKQDTCVTKPTINAHIVGKLPFRKTVIVTIAKTEPSDFICPDVSVVDLHQISIWLQPGV